MICRLEDEGSPWVDLYLEAPVVNPALVITYPFLPQEKQRCLSAQLCAGNTVLLLSIAEKVSPGLCWTLWSGGHICPTADGRSLGLREGTE